MGTLEIVGPDLAKAEPITEVVARLAPLRNGYSADFLDALQASGMTAQVVRDADGVDHLEIWLPADSQEALRNDRYDGLLSQMRRGKFRRRRVIDHLNMIGRFMDNQPFASVEEAAAAYLALGGRIWVRPEGTCEKTMPYQADIVDAEAYERFPLRRLLQRYGATLRQPGSREVMTAYVREHGKLHEGSGCIVLETEGQADA